MKCSKNSELAQKLGRMKPAAVRPPQKIEILEDEDTSDDDFSQVSVFHSISDIMRIHSSGLSYNTMNEMRQNIERLIKGTDSIGDLILDGKTTLIFRETTLEIKKEDIINRRFIIYQKPNSEGQLKIKSLHLDDTLADREDDEPFTFRQCTFFLCDTRESRDTVSQYLPIGIKIACGRKLRFIDCAFLGIEFFQGGTRTSGVDFMVFSDSFCKINIELEHCYFAGPKAILQTNMEGSSLVVNHCSFDSIDSNCLSLVHPVKLVVTNCNFVNCKGSAIGVTLCEEDNQEKPAKKVSLFANSSKIDTAVAFINRRKRVLKEEDNSQRSSLVNPYQ